MEPEIGITHLQTLPQEIAATIEANYIATESNIVVYYSKGIRETRIYYGIIMGLNNNYVYSFDRNLLTSHLLLLWFTFGGNQQLISYSATKFINYRPPHRRNGVAKAIEHLEILMRSAVMPLNFIRPLARPFEAKLIKPKERLLLQPKYDGVRCLTLIDGNKITFHSKKNKKLNPGTEILNVITIQNLGRRSKKMITLDGELLLIGSIPTFFASFQEIASCVTISEDKKPRLIYIIFDVYWENCNLSLQQRIYWLRQNIIQAYNLRISLGVFLDATRVFALLPHLTQWFNDQYEGIMIKPMDLPQNGILSRHMKYKFFNEEPAIIRDIILGPEGRPLFLLSRIGLDTERIKVIGRFSQAMIQRIYTHRKQFIGQQGTIRYCQITKNNIPRGATFHSLEIVAQLEFL